MSDIDFSRMVTQQAKASQQASDVKTECRSRIAAVLDAHTLVKVQNLALTGGLTPAQSEACRKGQRWIADMLIAGRRAVADGTGPVWPDPPAAIESLTEIEESFLLRTDAPPD